MNFITDLLNIIGGFLTAVEFSATSTAAVAPPPFEVMVGGTSGMMSSVAVVATGAAMPSLTS